MCRRLYNDRVYYSKNATIRCFDKFVLTIQSGPQYECVTLICFTFQQACFQKRSYITRCQPQSHLIPRTHSSVRGSHLVSSDLKLDQGASWRQPDGTEQSLAWYSRHIHSTASVCHCGHAWPRTVLGSALSPSLTRDRIPEHAQSLFGAPHLPSAGGAGQCGPCEAAVANTHDALGGVGGAGWRQSCRWPSNSSMLSMRSGPANPPPPIPASVSNAKPCCTVFFAPCVCVPTCPPGTLLKYQAKCMWPVLRGGHWCYPSSEARTEQFWRHYVHAQEQQCEPGGMQVAHMAMRTGVF